MNNKIKFYCTKIISYKLLLIISTSDTRLNTNKYDKKYVHRIVVCTLKEVIKLKNIMPMMYYVRKY